MHVYDCVIRSDPNTDHQMNLARFRVLLGAAGHDRKRGTEARERERERESTLTWCWVLDAR